MIIATKQDWWDCVNKNWENLLKIMHKFLPMHINIDIDGNFIGAPLIDKVMHLKENNDIGLRLYLYFVWWSAPEPSGVLHNIPGWWELCGLCMESEILCKYSQ